MLWLLRYFWSLWKRARPRSIIGRFYLYAMPWGIPFYGFVYWGQAYWHDRRVFWGATLLFAALSVVCVVGATFLTELTIRWFPGPQQAGRRVSLNLLLLLLFIVLGTRLNMAIWDATHLFGYSYRPATDPWVLVSVAVVYVLIAAVAEAVYVISEWRRSQLEAQQLRQQQVRRQLDEVKQQVNPHFLFNCLTSLSVLISEAPQQAEQFVDEMARVYRYLLHAHRHNQQAAGLTPLAAELDFLHAYAYLLGTRFGAGIRFELPPPEGHYPGQLLPLTLQTLVDNAIRHNVAATDTPLHIRVEATPAGQLRVRNTLQPRPARGPSGHESLSALQARYHLLGGSAAVQTTVEAEDFCVSVHLF